LLGLDTSSNMVDDRFKAHPNLHARRSASASGHWRGSPASGGRAWLARRLPRMAFLPRAPAAGMTAWHARLRPLASFRAAAAPSARPAEARNPCTDPLFSLSAFRRAWLCGEAVVQSLSLTPAAAWTGSRPGPTRALTGARGAGMTLGRGHSRNTARTSRRRCCAFDDVVERCCAWW